MLSGNIKNEYDLYNKALKATNSDELPSEYSEAINKCWFAKEQGETNDTKITNLARTLKDRLEEAIKIPSVFTIIKYAFANILKVRKDELLLIEKSDIKGDTIVQSLQENNTANKKSAQSSERPKILKSKGNTTKSKTKKSK